MTDWKWVSVEVASTTHADQIAAHGGLSGVRDWAALESAMSRPKNLAAYVESDAAALAASYAYGLARNHPFSDGNKRTAWVVARLFIRVNESKIAYTDEEVIAFMLALAAGELTEEAAADWFRARLA